VRYAQLVGDGVRRARRFGMKKMQQFGYDVWALVKGYWWSQERWSA
jgi:hypothetical protein